MNCVGAVRGFVGLKSIKRIFGFILTMKLNAHNAGFRSLASQNISLGAKSTARNVRRTNNQHTNGALAQSWAVGTPAMEAGIIKSVWSIADLLNA